MRVTPAGARDPELETDHVFLGSASTTSTRNRRRPPLPCSRGRWIAGDRGRRNGRPPLSPVAGMDGAPNERRVPRRAADRGRSSRVASRVGQVALRFTAKHQFGPKPLVGPNEDRAKFKWDRPPEVFPGFTRAFVICVPSTELMEPAGPDPLTKPATWLPAPPSGHQVVDIWRGAPADEPCDVAGDPLDGHGVPVSEDARERRGSHRDRLRRPDRRGAPPEHGPRQGHHAEGPPGRDRGRSRRLWGTTYGASCSASRGRRQRRTCRESARSPTSPSRGSFSKSHSSRANGHPPGRHMLRPAARADR